MFQFASSKIYGQGLQQAKLFKDPLLTFLEHKLFNVYSFDNFLVYLSIYFLFIYFFVSFQNVREKKEKRITEIPAIVFAIVNH